MASNHCTHCLRDDVKVMRCGGCGETTYCSKECQTAAWNAGHKRECKKIKKKKSKKKKPPPSSAGASAAGSSEDGSLFTGMDATTARRLDRGKYNVRSTQCAGCGAAITKATRRDFNKKCGKCLSVWYCAQDCLVRHWNEPPWGAGRDIIVPESRMSGVNVKATVNAQGHSIVKHRTVCPLLQAVYEEGGEHEEKMEASGGERTVEAYFELAMKAGQRGQLDKAIAAFNEVIQIDPEDVNAH